MPNGTRGVVRNLVESGFLLITSVFQSYTVIMTLKFDAQIDFAEFV